MGFIQPSPEFMQEWMAWFKSIESQTVQQYGFMNGRELKKEGLSDLPMDLSAMTGMLVIEAEDMKTAIEIAKSGPMVSSTRIYELMSHS